MDSQRLSPRTGSTWTNEKHLNFLNAMESSFVQTMLQTNNARLLHLDRYLPDNSDSTLDLETHTREEKLASPVDDVGSTTEIDGEADKRTRRPSSQSQPCNSSQDQVVPHIGNMRDEQEDQSHRPTTAPMSFAN